MDPTRVHVYNRSERKFWNTNKQSKAHNNAQRVTEKKCDNLNASHLKATCAVFHSAYYLTQNDRTYNDRFGLLELQSQNGVEIEDFSCIPTRVQQISSITLL